MSSPPLLDSLHCAFIQGLDDHRCEFEYWAMEHLRMSAVYWSLTSLVLLRGREWEASSPLTRDEIIAFVAGCQNEDGGFGGNLNMDSHLLFTLSAVQVLHILGALDSIDTALVAGYVLSVHCPSSGAFAGDARFGEIDTRFSYCAVSVLRLVGALDVVDVDLVAGHVLACQNPDGGFGAVPGAESHAGQIFCCLGTLRIVDRLAQCNTAPLVEWLVLRQLPVGGFNGRPEKTEDVCYSWWVLASLAMLGCVGCIDRDRLIDFILQCQDDVDGGIADRPGDLADVFHTLFGLAGLSLLSHPGVGRIDPVLCMPVCV